jgi:hypothetical protein
MFEFENEMVFNKANQLKLQRSKKKF